jgi:hypothetical protein
MDGQSGPYVSPCLPKGYTKISGSGKVLNKHFNVGDHVIKYKLLSSQWCKSFTSTNEILDIPPMDASNPILHGIWLLSHG